jgi:MFS family permease
MRHDIAEGLRYLWKNRLLRTLAIMVGVGNLAQTASMAVLPLYAVSPGPLGLSDAGYGVLLTAGAIGSVVGSFLVEPLTRRFGRAGTLWIAVAAFAAQMGILLWANVVAIFSVTLVAGALSMGWNVITVSLRQHIVPDHLLGRVNSGYRLLAWGTMPLGAAFGGLIGEAFGLRAVFLVATVVTVSTFGCARIIREQAILDAESASALALASAAST